VDDPDPGDLAGHALSAAGAPGCGEPEEADGPQAAEPLPSTGEESDGALLWRPDGTTDPDGEAKGCAVTGSRGMSNDGSATGCGAEMDAGSGSDSAGGANAVRSGAGPAGRGGAAGG
jgi:hypothetical protein